MSRTLVLEQEALKEALAELISKCNKFLEYERYDPHINRQAELVMLICGYRYTKVRILAQNIQTGNIFGSTQQFLENDIISLDKVFKYCEL